MLSIFSVYQSFVELKDAISQRTVEAGLVEQYVFASQQHLLDSDVSQDTEMVLYHKIIEIFRTISLHTEVLQKAENMSMREFFCDLTNIGRLTKCLRGQLYYPCDTNSLQNFLLPN